MAIKGYARVSSKDQNEGRQVEKFRSLGIEERNIFLDKASGKDFNRPEYQFLKRSIQPEDLIYIDALDRLGRDYDGIIKEWKEITRELGADIVCLDNKELFDSRKFKSMGDMGKLLEDQFLSLLGYVAEQERKKIRQRQREGIDKALSEKRAYGRPRQFKIDNKFKEVYVQWKQPNGIKAVYAMKLLGIGKTQFYELAKQYEKEQGQA